MHIIKIAKPVVASAHRGVAGVHAGAAHGNPGDTGDHDDARRHSERGGSSGCRSGDLGSIVGL